MSEDKITLDDVMMYESLFTIAPSILLGTMIRRKANLVKRFSSQIEHYLANLDNEQKYKLDLILNSEVEDLQEVLAQAYRKTHKKQFKQLSDPKAREFIVLNLSYLKKIL